MCLRVAEGCRSHVTVRLRFCRRHTQQPPSLRCVSSERGAAVLHPLPHMAHWGSPPHSVLSPPSLSVPPTARPRPRLPAPLQDPVARLLVLPARPRATACALPAGVPRSPERSRALGGPRPISAVFTPHPQWHVAQRLVHTGRLRSPALRMWHWPQLWSA